MDKMKRAQSSTGVVHYIEDRPGKAGKGGLVVPFCDGQINGVFINWKLWPLTKESVTCKNCLRKAGEKMHSVRVDFGCRANAKQHKFATKKELDAYLKGVRDAQGWYYIEIDKKEVLRGLTM